MEVNQNKMNDYNVGQILYLLSVGSKLVIKVVAIVEINITVALDGQKKRHVYAEISKDGVISSNREVLEELSSNCVIYTSIPQVGDELQKRMNNVIDAYIAEIGDRTEKYRLQNVQSSYQNVNEAEIQHVEQPTYVMLDDGTKAKLVLKGPAETMLENVKTNKKLVVAS